MSSRDEVRSSFGIYALSWNATLASSRLAWTKKCAAMIVGMMACSICGYVVFPISHLVSMSHFTTIVPTASHAPSAVANMHLRHHVHAPVTTRRPEARWYECHQCKAGRDHGKYLVRHRPAEMQMIFKSSVTEVQLLSFLQVSTLLSERYRGFAHGTIDVQTLIRHPLISWNVNNQEPNFEPCEAVSRLLHLNLRQNPLYAKYRCLLELVDPSVGMPIVSESYVSHILMNAISRGPRVITETNPLPIVLSTAIDVPVPMLLEGGHRDMSVPIKAGDIALRMGSVDVRSPLMLMPGEVVQDVGELTIETAMFPFLFPHGTGAFDNGMTFTSYLRMRMLQAFSVFTLFKPYLLLMFQVRQAILLRNQVKALVLSKSIVDYKRRHPGCSAEDALANAVKWTVPSSLPVLLPIIASNCKICCVVLSNGVYQISFSHSRPMRFQNAGLKRLQSSMSSSAGLVHHLIGKMPLSNAPACFGQVPCVHEGLDTWP